MVDISEIISQYISSSTLDSIMPQVRSKIMKYYAVPSEGTAPIFISAPKKFSYMMLAYEQKDHNPTEISKWLRTQHMPMERKNVKYYLKMFNLPMNIQHGGRRFSLTLKPMSDEERIYLEDRIYELAKKEYGRFAKTSRLLKKEGFKIKPDVVSKVCIAKGMKFDKRYGRIPVEILPQYIALVKKAHHDARGNLFSIEGKLKRQEAPSTITLIKKILDDNGLLYTETYHKKVRKRHFKRVVRKVPKIENIDDIVYAANDLDDQDDIISSLDA